MIPMLYHNVLPEVEEYVESIKTGKFEDVQAENGIFKGIQERGEDALYSLVSNFMPEYEIVMNFVRKSSSEQEEPNFIHTDEMHGDKTLILYLNEEYPEGYGTTLYDDNEVPILIHKAQFNSVFIFDSFYKHSRNLKENFGKGTNARMVQVMFLKKQTIR
tara:strand:+ start:3697 stop:4176 length:480 start_codon:yes stop_codon:yes gene_type:complete